MGNSLSEFTTFGIGGRIGKLVVASTRDVLAESAEEGIVLGRGSKVLASDDGYDGTVTVNRYDRVDINGELVVAGSGVTLPSLSYRVAEAGLSGLEWAEGIPGTVGGAVRMNAGAFGGEIADRLVYADVIRGGKIVRLTLPELGLGYRSSALGARDVVIEAAFLLTADDARAVKARCAQNSAARRMRQPRGKSAGSVFKNPTGMAIGRLIESAGLKGYRCGGAMVSAEHANIIVNTGGATARDVCRIISTIKSELYDRYNIKAQEELIYIGGF